MRVTRAAARPTAAVAAGIAADGGRSTRMEIGVTL